MSLAEAQNAGSASGSLHPRWQGRPWGHSISCTLTKCTLGRQVKWGRQKEDWGGGELGERRGLGGAQVVTASRAAARGGSGSVPRNGWEERC